MFTLKCVCNNLLKELRSSILTKRGEAEYLLERSRRFFETSIIQIDRGFYDLAVLSLEQSIQLYLKACLLKLGADYPRTHSVRRLLELIGVRAS